MLLPRFVAGMAWIAVTVLGNGALFSQPASTGSGQAYPNKPIRIVTGEIGGGTDITARQIAQGITVSLGQQVIVDNRGGGSAPGETVAKALPDGYTLLLHGNAQWLLPFLRDHVPYDPVRDFLPITTAASSPSVLVVPPSLPAKSVAELIALSKSRPGELNYASGPTGAAAHLSGELFKAMAGVNIMRITYKGTAAALNDVIAGQVQVMFANAAAAIPHIKSGRVRILAVTSVRPSVLFPEVPTMSASGLPGYESGSISAIFAPARTPGMLINRLNREIVGFLNRTDVKERFLNSSVETVGGTPGELAATVRSEMIRWGKVIKEAGIREE